MFCLTCNCSVIFINSTRCFWFYAYTNKHKPFLKIPVTCALYYHFIFFPPHHHTSQFYTLVSNSGFQWNLSNSKSSHYFSWSQQYWGMDCFSDWHSPVSFAGVMGLCHGITTIAQTIIGITVMFHKIFFCFVFSLTLWQCSDIYPVFCIPLIFILICWNSKIH